MPLNAAPKDEKMTARQLQATYYAETAFQYDELHTSDAGDEHYAALRIIDAVSDLLGLTSFLDVGAGTGRAAFFLRRPGREVRGIEPVQALIDQAIAKGAPEDLIVCGDGHALPFEDESFDAVLECGMLHHVADPSAVVKEMMRVARKAVFLSDANRFGQGGAGARILKLALYQTRLWRIARYLQTRGKGYTVSSGDGIAYSYSIYDSYRQLAEWADVVWCLPTRMERRSHSWLHPLVTSSQGLLCAMRARDGKPVPLCPRPTD